MGLTNIWKSVVKQSHELWGVSGRAPKGGIQTVISGDDNKGAIYKDVSSV